MGVLILFLKSSRKFNILRKVVPEFNALSAAFCIVGPSARGSEKGTPSSIRSAPACSSIFSLFAVS